jgi:hypothetical protein
MRLLGFIIASVSLHAGILTFGTFTPLPGTEGASINGTLASFSDSNHADTAANILAIINWGDGTVTPGTIIGSAGAFSLSASHTYLEEGDYSVGLSINDGVGDTASATGTEVVADAPLSSTGGSPFGFTPGVLTANLALLSFTDANPAAGPADFFAIINWGDSTNSVGTILSSIPGVFSVRGSHAYAASGVFTVSVGVTDTGGSTTLGTTTATGVPEPGSIGMVFGGLALAGFIRMRRG